MANRNIVPLYFGTKEREIFGWYHPGAGAESMRPVGVVLCNPIGDDYTRAHRTIRHLAEKLSAAGFPVLRFDFYGTGDSAGSEEDEGCVNFWLKDMDYAIEELRKLSGTHRFALAGLKFGATLAVAAAERREDIESLVLWSPYLSGKDYVSDAIRVHKVYKTINSNAFAMDPPGRKISGEECLGFVLSDSTITDLKKIDLLTLEKLSAKKVLITGDSRSWQNKLANYLTKMGSTVDFQMSAGSDKFLVMINHKASVPEKVIDRMTAWMNTHIDEEGVTGNFQQQFPDPLTFKEEPILFGDNNSLFGVLHPGKTAQNELPALVMLNSGTVHRIGPHRLYVKMARKWAELGFSVFRIDLAGIGDSAAVPGSEENLCYPPSAQQDIQAAFKVLETRSGTKNFILIGLCSGADITFKTGCKDPRVVGTILMNPLTFCIHDPWIVETECRSFYLKKSFFSKEKWLRLFKGKVSILEAVRTVVANLAMHLSRKSPELQGSPENVPECLRRMVEKGVDTLIVATEKDPGIHYVDIHSGEAMKALEDLDGYRRRDFYGTDHTFTSNFAQGMVTTVITDHIVGKYL